MPGSPVRLLLMALAICLPLAARAESLPRKESNVSIRNEVQLAIDQGLAHLLRTQRADGTWGKLGTTGLVLTALVIDPRERGRSIGQPSDFAPALQKGYLGVRNALAATTDLRNIPDFAWNLPPATLALSGSPDPLDGEQVARARAAIGAAPVPEAQEARAFFLAVDPKHRAPGEMPANPSGSALAAWLYMIVNREPTTGFTASSRAGDPVADWLRNHYTLERNPAGDGVHQYYFWLSRALGPPSSGRLEPELKLSNGVTVDLPRQLAEKLINAQNGNGSWSGVGEHWTEKDPDLVTALCVLTLEQVHGQL